MWSPDKLHIENLQSHSDTTFVFKKGRVVMIKGVNKYDKVPKSNGSGKSVLIEGLSIAFTGDQIRKVSTPDLVKDGAKSALIEFWMTNTVSRDVLYIKRRLSRSNNTPAKLIIELNGDPVDFAKVRDGNDWILETIGISKQDLFNYYIISKSKYTSFYYSTDAEKRKLISRFSNADMIDGVYDNIKVDSLKVQDEIAIINEELASMDGRKLGYEEMMEDDFEQKKQNAINRVQESIVAKKTQIDRILAESANMSDQLDEAEYEVVQAKEAVKKAKGCRDAFKKVDYSEERNAVRSKIADVEASVEPDKASLKEVDGMVSDIDKMIVGKRRELAAKEVAMGDVVQCPKCEHSFSVSTEASEEDIQKEIDSINKEIADLRSNRDECVGMQEKLKNKIASVGGKVQELNAEIAAINKKDGEQTDAIHNLQRQVRSAEMVLEEKNRRVGTIKSRMSSAIDNVEVLEAGVKELEAEIETIKNQKDDKTELKNKIKTVSKQIDEKTKEKLKLAEKQSGIERWTEIFKKFNIKLSNMAVKSIEGLSNDILAQMGSNLSLEIDGYKVTRTGTISDVIDAKVMRYGVLEGSFFRFSQGEQTMMNISTTLAMQQLINMGCESGGMDLMFIDEITESADSSVIKEVVRSLDKLGRTIAIITHVSDEETMIENEVTVVKTAEGSTCQTN